MNSPLESLSDYFGGMTDLRKAPQVRYPLPEILFLVLSALVCDCEDWEEIEDFGNDQLGWLRGYHPYAQGIPAHDTLNRVMGMLDPQEFSQNFSLWMSTWLKLPEQMLISIDGKTSRGSRDKHNGTKALHSVSAYVHSLGMVLGQVATEEKSNEITAIPLLLRLLSLQGVIITMDAMGTQVAIVQQITEGGGHYILPVKDNQRTLHEEIQDSFRRIEAVDTHEEVEKSRGRIETRKVSVINDLSWILERERWPGLQQLVRVERTRELLAEQKTERETSYYISSVGGTARELQVWIRGHWGIENGLHWCLDVIFREDMDRKRSENAAHNIALMRKAALNLFKAMKSIYPKLSMKRMRKQAARNDSFRQEIFQKM
ncbi:MAG: ISAs1 family transposase [Bacteroidia bacterium]|nr:ISAs1 family transposase [Bacteroidia bacterium]